jgi:hypothetical protein
MSFRVKPSSLRLNESNSLSTQLVLAAVPNGLSTKDVKDYSRNQYQNAGTFSVLGGASGTVAKGLAPSTFLIEYPVPSITLGPGLALCAVIDRWTTTQTGGDRFVISAASSSSDTPLIGIDSNGSTIASGPSGSLMNGFLRDGSNNGPQAFGSVAGFRDDSQHVLIVNSESAISHSFFADGVLAGSSTTSFAATTINQLAILGVWRTTRSLWWSGGVSAGFIWNRALTRNEISEISADPFAMFRPRQRSYFYAALAEPPTPTFKPYWRQTPQLSTAGVIG